MCDIQECEAKMFIQYLIENGHFYLTTIDSIEVYLKIPNKELSQHIFKAVNNMIYSEKSEQ